MKAPTMIAIRVKWTARPSIEPAAPQSVAGGNGPEATKRSIAAGSRPRHRVSKTANRISRVPQMAVAMTSGRNMGGMVPAAALTSSFLSVNVAILPPNDQFQARPGRIDRAHLHIDQAHRKADVSDHVLRYVGRNLRYLLRPADPDHPGGVEERKQLVELGFKVSPLG